MTILVLSDSHGNIRNMQAAVEQVNPDLVFHLGDCCRDAARLREQLPALPMEQVRGNCDYHAKEPIEQLLTIEGKRILLCHGHSYGVKGSLHQAEVMAKDKALDLFLFGHTHVPLCDYHGTTLFLNPGSIGDYRIPTYGVIRIADGKLRGDLFRVDA